jgi:hypothetical protein
MRDYREQLQVPLAWWLLAVPTVLILGVTLYAGLPDPWPIIIMAGLVLGCAALLISMSLARVEISGGTLRAGSAVLPLTAITEVAARLYSRPYLKASVYLAVDPAFDPAVPYWLIGTRHPAELAAVIQRCRTQAGHEPVA